jgi:hypothetical protein
MNFFKINQYKGIIFLKSNIWYEMENVIKIGFTNSMKEKNNFYITNNINREKNILLIEISLKEIVVIEKLLKNNFKQYHIYKSDRTNFYNRCISELIEPYLKSLNIEYKILLRNKNHNIIKDKQITNIKKILNYVNSIQNL